MPPVNIIWYFAMRNSLRLYVFRVIAMLSCGFLFCCAPAPVHIAEPTSACARLRTSYPSDYGLILFSDPTTTTRSIQWCFPGTGGFGIMAYNINIPITNSGTFSLVLSNIVPTTRFAARSINATCASSPIGKSYVGLGNGTQWAMPVVPGNYCLTLGKLENEKEDVWFTLTAIRP